MMKLACRMQHEKVVRRQLEELRKSERLNVLVKINDHRRTSALPARDGARRTDAGVAAEGLS
jgi:hypothetical protein